MPLPLLPDSHITAFRHCPAPVAAIAGSRTIVSRSRSPRCRATATEGDFLTEEGLPGGLLPRNHSALILAGALDSAERAILAAPNGSQKATFSYECFSIGRLCAGIGHHAEAMSRLLSAGQGMVNHDPRRPWTYQQIVRKVESRFRAGLARGPRRGGASCYPNGEDKDAPQYGFPLTRFNDIKFRTDSYYVVQNIIPREGLVVVWGPPKCGKTFWVFDLGMHIALGWIYRGHRVEQGPVVYIACEGERGIAARKEAYSRERLDGKDVDPPFFICAKQLNLPAQVISLTNDIIAQLKAEPHPQPPAAVIIDTSIARSAAAKAPTKT